VYRGGVTFLQIKRLTGRQAAIGGGLVAGPHAATSPVASGQAAEPPTMPLPVTGATAGQGTASGAWPPWQPAGRPPDPVNGGAARPPSGPARPGPALPGPALPGPALPGPALPDVSEVLDEAFGERRE
jgi:hypothetical protein